MPIHHNPAGILRKLPAVLAAFALIMASTVAVDQEPASAACVFHRHDTWPNVGWWEYSWAREIPPHDESTCNDVNVVWARRTGVVRGQYLHGQHGWVFSNAGLVWMRAGAQRPWRVVVENLHNGSLYRVATPENWRTFLVAV